MDHRLLSTLDRPKGITCLFCFKLTFSLEWSGGYQPTVIHEHWLLTRWASQSTLVVYQNMFRWALGIILLIHIPHFLVSICPIGYGHWHPNAKLFSSQSKQTQNNLVIWLLLGKDFYRQLHMSRRALLKLIRWRTINTPMGWNIKANIWNLLNQTLTRLVYHADVFKILGEKCVLSH